MQSILSSPTDSCVDQQASFWEFTSKIVSFVALDCPKMGLKLLL